MKEATKKDKLTFCTELFWSFFKLSPVSFGGGFAMIPILESEIVQKRQWIEKEKIVDIFSLAQSAPGAIAVNSAIFVGYQVAGIYGAIAAMLGMVIPTFIIILIMASIFITFQENHHIAAVLDGIRPVIVALIASAAYRMKSEALVDKFCYIVCIVCILVLMFSSINIVWVIIGGALSGFLIKNINEMKR
jgi:chromate transporter